MGAFSESIISLEREVAAILRENGWSDTRMGFPAKDGFYLAKCGTIAGEFIGLYNDRKHDGAVLLRKMDVDAPQIAIDFVRRVDIEAQADRAIASGAQKDTILLYEKNGNVASLICSQAESERLYEDLREQVHSASVYTYPGQNAEMLYAVTNVKDRIDNAAARLAHEIHILKNAPRDWDTRRAIMAAVREAEESENEVQYERPRG